MKPSGPGLLFFWEIFDHSFYFIACNWVVHNFYFLLVQSRKRSCMDVRVGLKTKLSTEELMLLNCGVGKDSCESHGLQGDPAGPS